MRGEHILTSNSVAPVRSCPVDHFFIFVASSPSRWRIFWPLRRFLTKRHSAFSQLIWGSWWILSLKYSKSRKPYAWWMSRRMWWLKPSIQALRICSKARQLVIPSILSLIVFATVFSSGTRVSSAWRAISGGERPVFSGFSIRQRSCPVGCDIRHLSGLKIVTLNAHFVFSCVRSLLNSPGVSFSEKIKGGC